MPSVFISGSGKVVTAGFHAATAVRIVFSIPAPFKVMPDFGSKGAANS